jgi:3-deoxy-D-manno-octulosonic-acid transferase
VKILLIRVSSLGDVLHNLPLVNDLHRHYPDAQIDWVVEEAYVRPSAITSGHTPHYSVCAATLA